MGCSRSNPNPDSDSRRPFSCVPGGSPSELRQRGAALPVVLSVLAAFIALAALLMQRGRMSTEPWVRARDKAQARYWAESGLAWALYCERYGLGRDTAGKESTGNLGSPLSASQDTAEELHFRLDTSAILPTVNVDRGKPFLEITSQGRQGKDSLTVIARFGRRLDPLAFGGALTWENDIPVQSFSEHQIQGALKLKTATPGITASPWPEGFSVSSYAEDFAAELFRQSEAGLSKALAKPKGESGNGHFDSHSPPNLERHEGEFRFPLGQIDIVGGAFDSWNLPGPAKFFSHGDIRLRGKIKLENITLASEGSIFIEGEVAGKGLHLFARGNISLMGKSQLELEAVAGGNIVLQDQAKTLGNSLLLVKKGGANKANGDTVCAIRISQEATAEGYLLALGTGSRVVLAGPANRVLGIVLADEAWLAGTIDGSVAVRQLRCGENKPPQCLGSVVIRRQGLPEGFLQPLKLGPSNPEHLQFQLLSYEAR